MKYYYKKPELYFVTYGFTYYCNHPIYNSCTLYKIGDNGLAVIQQRYDYISKKTWWTEIDPWLIDDIYKNPRFKEYFKKHSKISNDGLFPTVSVRQIMWGLKMKPLKRSIWETVFDRCDF